MKHKTRQAKASLFPAIEFSVKLNMYIYTYTKIQSYILKIIDIITRCMAAHDSLVMVYCLGLTNDSSLE